MAESILNGGIKMLDFNQLIWTFIFHIINIIILYFILRRFLFKPIRNFLNAREEKFKARKAELDERQRKIDEMEALCKQKLEEAKNEAKKIIDKANEGAQDHLREARLQASEQVKLMLERGRKELEAERKLAMEELKTQAAILAVEIASKILEKNITVEDNKRIIEEFLEEVK